MVADLVDLAGEVGVIAGAGVAVIALVSALITVAVKIHRIAKRADGVLDYVAGEMKNNGGATLRDAVDRMERRQRRIEQHLGISAEEENPQP